MVKNIQTIKALVSVIESLLETEDLGDALSGGLDIVVRALGCEEGVVWVLDKLSGRLFPLACVGPADVSNVSIEKTIGLPGLVMNTGETVVVTDAASDQRYDGSVFEDNGLSVRSVLCAPMTVSREVVGCIQLINAIDEEGFGEEEIKLCKRMAAITSMLFEEQSFSFHAAEDRKPLIRLRNIIKEFPSGDGVIRVLKGINLDIYKGEFLVVLGESGCGKSKLVNIIGGMDSLTDGELIIDGKDFSHPTDRELTHFRREYMGFVFQSYNLMPNLSAQKNIQFIAEIAKDPMPAEEALALVGLSERAGNFPSALSGGQQQRVSIARAIVKNPQIIFADEPTAALDYHTSIEVLHVFEEIVKTKGSTVVMITHNPEIARMADRVIKLRDGKVFSIRRNLHPARAEELVW